MLHPTQFKVNEAWLAFKMNEVPIRTEIDGDFDCIALMDAASCFILGSTFTSAGEAEPSKRAVRQLLEEAGGAQESAAQNSLHPDRPVR